MNLDFILNEEAEFVWQTDKAEFVGQPCQWPEIGGRLVGDFAFADVNKCNAQSASETGRRDRSVEGIGGDFIDD